MKSYMNISLGLTGWRRCNPESTELEDTIKYFIHKTSMNLKNMLYGLCQVEGEEERNRTSLQASFHDENSLFDFSSEYGGL